MSSRTQSRQHRAAQWLESLEARLNPPMADDAEVFDPFADLPDADLDAKEGQATRLRLMFEWKPRRELMH